MKRFGAWLLSLVMVFSLLPVSALAADFTNIPEVTLTANKATTTDTVELTIHVGASDNLIDAFAFKLVYDPDLFEPDTSKGTFTITNAEDEDETVGLTVVKPDGAMIQINKAEVLGSGKTTYSVSGTTTNKRWGKAGFDTIFFFKVKSTATTGGKGTFAIESETAASFKLHSASDETLNAPATAQSVVVAIPIGAVALASVPETVAKNGTVPATTSVTSTNTNVITNLTWNNGATESGKFKGSTAYTATLTVTATDGLTFAENPTFTGITTSGEGAWTMTRTSDTVYTFTKTFPETLGKELLSIAVTGPTTTTYTDGDTIPTSELTVTATYDTGDETLTASEYEIVYSTGAGKYGDKLSKNDTGVTVCAKADNTKTDTITGLTVNGKTATASDFTIGTTSIESPASPVSDKKTTFNVTSETVSNFTVENNAAGDIQNVGTYTLKAIIAAEDPHYDAGTVVLTPDVTVTGRAVAKPTAIDHSTYNGSPQTLSSSAVTGWVDADMQFKTAAPSQTDAGVYDVEIELKDKNKTNWSDGTQTDVVLQWTIDPKSVTPTIEVANAGAYDGNEKKPAVTVKDGSTTITDTTEYTVTYSNNTDAGTAAKVTVTDAKTGTTPGTATGNYTIAEKTETFAIAKATTTLSGTPSITGWNYGEDAKAPSGVTTDYGTVVYKYSDTDDGTYTETVPYTVGTHYVKAFVEENKNWTSASTDAVSFTIGKGTLTLSPAGTKVLKAKTVYPTGSTTESYTIDLKDYISGIPGATPAYQAPGKVNFAAASNTGNTTFTDVAITSEGIMTFKVAQTSAGTAGDSDSFKVTVSSSNYNDANVTIQFAYKEKEDVSANITFADITRIYDATNTYNYETASITGVSGGTWTYVIKDSGDNTLATAPKDAGTYTITATYEDDTVTAEGLPGHIGIATATLTIEPKEVALTWAGADARDYDKIASNVTATVGNKADSADVVDVTVTGGTEMNAGTHTATASGLTGAQAGNYKLPDAKTKEYVINKAKLTLSGVSGIDDKSYDNTVTTSGTLTYTFTGAAAGETPTATATVEWTSPNAGTNTVKVTNLALNTGDAVNDNYQLTATSANSVSAGKEIAKATRTISVTPSGAQTVYAGQPVTLTVSFEKDLDNSAFKVFTATLADPEQLSIQKVNGEKSGDNGTCTLKLTALKPSATNTTLTLSLPETENYAAATNVEIAVTSITDLITTAAVTPAAGDTLTVSVDNEAGKIIVSGMVSNADNGFKVTWTNAGAAITTDPAAETGVTLKAGATTGNTFVVKVNGADVATYTVDVSGVKVKEASLGQVTADATPEGAATVDGLNYSDNVDKIKIGSLEADIDGAGETGKNDVTNPAATEINNAVKGLAKKESNSVFDVKMEVGVKLPQNYGTTDGKKSLTFDIGVQLVITEVVSAGGAAVAGGTSKTTTVTKLDSPLKIQVPIPSGFAPNFAKHIHNGITEYLKVTTSKVSGVDVASWDQLTFSEVSLVADSRKATVTYPDGTTVTYTAADVGKALPASTRGWNLGGATGATTLSDAMLTEMNSAGVAVTAVETPAPPVVTPPTTTPSTGGSWVAESETPFTFAINNATSNSEHGKIKLSSTNLSLGKTVTITVTPDEGYELDKITVTDANGNKIQVNKNKDGTYSFVMPASAVKVDATFVPSETPVNPNPTPVTERQFIDVPDSEFYADAVAWAVKMGITNGTSDIMFSPNAPCTRGQVVTFLYRAAGEPDVELTDAFADVAGNEYYAKAVAWAVANGITNGKGATDTFKPEDVCTRAEIVTFLARYEKASLTDVSTRFEDVPETEWFAGAVAWAVENGITSGTSATTFSPNDVCTRGQVVTFLYRDFANKQ